MFVMGNLDISEFIKIIILKLINQQKNQLSNFIKKFLANILYLLYCESAEKVK